LGQQPTGQARSVMHTTLDTLESLHLGTIHQGDEALVAIVKSIPNVINQTKEKNHVHAK
jgi:hypothetical protein